MENQNVNIFDVDTIRNAIRRLGTDHTVVTTVEIKTEATGRPYVTDRIHRTNIAFGEFLSLNRDALGIRFLYEGEVELWSGNSTTSAFWEII